MVAKKRLALGLALSLITEVVNRVFPILILHIVATRLGVEGFGFAQTAIQWIDIAIFVVNFGFPTPAAVEVGLALNRPVGRDKTKAICRTLSEVLFAKLGLALACFVFIYVLTDVSTFYRDYRDVLLALSFMLVTSALDMSFVLIGSQRVWVISLFMIAAKIISFLLILFFVKTSADTILYAVLSFGANGLVCLATFLYATSHFGLRLPAVRAVLRRLYGTWPYGVTIVLLVILDRYDLFLVQLWGGAQVGGLYAGAARLNLSFISVITALGTVFFSEMVAAKNKTDLTRYVSFAIQGLLLISMPVAALLWFVAGDVLGLILGDNYRAGAGVLRVLAVGSVAHVLLLVFGVQLLQVKGWMRALNMTLLLAQIFALLSSLILFGFSGIEGVAWGLIGVKALAALAFVVIARSALEYLPIQAIVRTGASTAIMAMILFWLDSGGLWTNLAAGSSIYLVCTFWLNREQLWRIYQIISQKIKSRRAFAAT